MHIHLLSMFIINYSVSKQFLVFPISTRVDITVYQYGKNVLYFFHNIAQRPLTEEWREIFRVDRVISTRLLANQRSEFTNATLLYSLIMHNFS